MFKCVFLKLCVLSASSWSHLPLPSLTMLMYMCVCVCVSSSAAWTPLEMMVGEEVNSMLLLNLLSGTEYTVEVTASYPVGQSEPLLANAKTRRYPYHT